MGNEQSRQRKAASSSTSSKGPKNPLAVLKSGSSSSKIQNRLVNARKSGVLQLVNCGIKQLPDSIDEVAGFLRNLDLSHNNISTIPARVSHFSNLKQLNFAHNRLAELPDEIGCLKTLETLDVSFNRLLQLPDSLAGCSSLKTLNASKNQISVFPIGVCHIYQMEHVELSSNRIKVIPDDITHLSAIELNLNENALSTLNDHLADCKRLRVLRVESNCLPKQAFSQKILDSSLISLIASNGNVFLEKELQDLPGYDVYQERYTATKRKGV